MIHTEKKFAYRHKPTGKWCFIDWFFNYELWENYKSPYVHELELVDNLADATFDSCKPALTNDLKHSTMNGERYAANNFLEFELVEIEVQYKIKEEYSEIKIHENLTGWPK